MADRNDEINQWLEENPLVLGGGAIVLGLVLIGSGVYELKSGVTRDKKGRVVEGQMGKPLSIFRIVIGAAVSAFGVYKLIT
ncbi:hypothetical protein [Thalassoglobus neptunius]|uniref:hypothetical protein n=1 Tax=Thalassoglobus neptunius TaxID=1938619 RepID=UPI0011B5B7DB|nr:hypothetical protein [Thalassoglobus neptunius]